MQGEEDQRVCSLVLFVVTVFGQGMRVLVPQPGMEPVPPVVEALATGLTGNALQPALS